MTTPEGKVKDKVKHIIEAYKPHVYSHWPVLNGMGHPTLDCIGCADGDFFAIETKAPGKAPTPQQRRTRAKMEDGGATVFIIVGHDPFAYDELDAWLHKRVMRKLSKQVGR